VEFWQVVSFSEPEQLLDIARGAEDAGFDGVLLSDHLFFPGNLTSRYPYAPDGRPGFDGATPFPEPWTAIAAMAAVTRRLRFGTMVYILPLRNPLEVAKTVGTAAVLSGGRVALGCGAGWIAEEFHALGVDFATRGRRFDEAIEVLRTVWRGDMVEHHGRYFDHGPLRMSPAPAAPIPIWVGGTSDAALRRAARLGDGWIGTGQHPDELPQLLGRLRAQREKAGRARGRFDVIVPLVVPPEPGLLRRLEAEHGVTATTAWPFSYTIGPGSSAAQKRDAMRRYADEVIAKLR
jgi:probable F420-dependent oxidoreductase